jgi:hypothetical protein
MGGGTLRDIGTIDYAKLLGFEAVSDQLSGGVDFQSEIIGAKPGAKVGAEAEPTQPPTLGKMD